MNRASSSSTDLIDAKLEEHRICSTMQCPSCGHKLDRKPDWVRLPAGVKFDPTDQELIEHLEAKVKIEEAKSHPLIDEFIPTIDGEDGICYTHPVKLPGVTTDGLSRHFFHRPSKAYTTGTRKRRKIQTECDLQKGETRWHKTGKTRPVMVNGKQKGCKKILVLYTNFGKQRKPEKTNWVMHQYHLGELEEEKDGELVVSKIFYQTQPRHCNGSAEKGTGSALAAAGDQVLDHRRDSAGSASCSSKEVIGHIDHEFSSAGHAGSSRAFSSMDIQHDGFSFPPFSQSFKEVRMCEQTTTTMASEVAKEHEERDHLQRLQAEHHMVHAATTASFHMTGPTNPISTLIPPAPLHRGSVVLDDVPYHVSTMLLQDQQQQQHQQQHQHHQQKLVDRSATGLEELIMGCTAAGMKGETSISHSQETEWQYPYWLPDNPDHHG